MNNKNKKAFTLIEVMISVILVYGLILGTLKLQGDNNSQSHYMIQRGNAELENSLFLTDRVQRYNHDTKSAYDLLENEFLIKEDESRNILKKIKKKITLSEETPIEVGTPDGNMKLTFYSNEIQLKKDYPARYYSYK